MTSRLDEQIKSKMGRPPVDSDMLRARVERCVLDALDAYASDEAVSRPQALRLILTDWLRTHGYKIALAMKPIGPATDAVEAMDAAIKAHRGSRPKAKPEATNGARSRR